MPAQGRSKRFENLEVGLGVRELIIGVLALLGVYVVWVLLRLNRLRRARQAAAVQAPEQAEYQTVIELEPVREPTPAPAPPPPRVEVAPAVEPEAPVPRVPAQPLLAPNEPFDALVEVARLRFQIEGLEIALATLRNDMVSLRAEFDALKLSRNVAPQYGEAVGLAQRGYGSETIAERCGISVSEAELVTALARGARKDE